MYDQVITLNDSQLKSPHWLRTATPDGQFQYLLTGVVVPHVQASGVDWEQRTVRATIPIGGLAAGQKFTANQWAPHVSLAAVNADSAPMLPGWAVDGFELVAPNTPSDHVVLDIKTAVRDANCLLLRMSYQITMIGNIT